MPGIELVGVQSLEATDAFLSSVQTLSLLRFGKVVRYTRTAAIDQYNKIHVNYIRLTQ